MKKPAKNRKCGGMGAPKSVKGSAGKKGPVKTSGGACNGGTAYNPRSRNGKGVADRGLSGGY